MTLTNTSKPTSVFANTSRAAHEASWNDNTTTWNTETRTWLEMGSLLSNTASRGVEYLATQALDYLMTESNDYLVTGTNLMSNTSKP